MDALSRATDLAKSYNITVIMVDTPELWTTKALVVENQLLINVKRFRSAVASQANARSLNWSSTADPDHIILHEIFHFLHYRKVGRDIYDHLNRPVAINRDYVCTMVGNYAATNEGEYVAEVYVGLQIGVVYTDDIMNHYRALWNEH